MAASKLQTIAKLSGSFAVSGLVAQQLGGIEDCVGIADAVERVLLPRRAHAYFAIRKSPRLPTVPERAETFHALNQNGEFVKVYPVELRLKTVQSQFEFGTLSFALLRSLVVTYVPLLNNYFEDLKRAEESAEAQGVEIDWEDLPRPDWVEVKRRIPKVLINIVRDTVVGVVRILLSWTAAEKLDRRLTWKLVKDLPASIRAKRKYPFYQRPFLVTRTNLRGFVIPNLAELLVSSSIEAVSIALFLRTPAWQKLKMLARRVTEKALFLTVSLAASSTAAGIVGLVYPSMACGFAALAAGFATDTFIGLPAVRLYEHERRVTRSSKIIITASAGIVVLSFLPWIWPSSDSKAALPVPSLVIT